MSAAARERVIARWSRVARAWIILPLVFGLFFLLPVVGLLARAITDGDVSDQLRTGATWTTLRLSVLTATLTLLLAVAFGTPLAYLLATRQTWWSRAAATLIELPIVLPPVVSGIALLTVFGRRGYVGEPLDAAGIQLSFTTAAVVVAQLFVSAPFYIRAAYAGFTATDPRFEGIAYTLGLSRRRTFRSVTLPLVWPALAGGAVLCWARALGELGATLLFAGSLPGSTQTMPLAIIAAFESQAGLAGAVSIAVILVGFATILLLALTRVTASRGPYR
jgi:molybdate transport system permease protein